MSSVYRINKGINQPIEFKGLKAQYIWYLGGGLLILLILFAGLYICGLNSFACITVIIVCASALFVQVYRLSRKYGQYGMMKSVARRSLPRVIKSYSRKPFLQLYKSRPAAFHRPVSVRKKNFKNTDRNKINKSLL